MRVSVDYRIEIRTKLRGIDPCGIYRCICDGRARHEATSFDRPQLPHGRAVSAHVDCSPGFHLTKHCAGLSGKKTCCVLGGARREDPAECGATEATAIGLMLYTLEVAA
jgi:hypothetical protein